MVDNFDDISLDPGDIQAQVEEESRFAGELMVSEYRTGPLPSMPNIIKRTWRLEWRKIINDPGFSFASIHNLPDPDRAVMGNARRRMSYTQQAEAFAALGVKGRRPEDFLGLRCWIQETVTPGRTSEYDKRWWKPVALYIEGEPFPGTEGTSQASFDMSTDNSGTSNNTSEATGEYDYIVSLINGKTQRQAVLAIGRDAEVANTPELIVKARNGTLFDELVEAGLITEESGIFKSV